MSQPVNEAINLEGRPRVTVDISTLLPPTLFPYPHLSSRCTGSNRNVPQSAQNPISQASSNFSDSSGPLFNLYVKMAEEEDNKIADRWQKDADGILIFVSPHIRLRVHPLNIVTNVDIVDWFILCCSRCIGRCLYPGPQAKFTGYFSILPCEHLSASRRPKCISCIDPCHSC
jgi:hypothetical protein